jgi:hypothetical protein
MYGIHIWSVASAACLNKLIIKQKFAIRIICDAKYNAHSEPLFKISEILPLNHLIKFAKLLFMFDYAQNSLPSSFTNLWPTNAQIRLNEENPRHLRNDNELYVPFIRLETFIKFPLSDFPRTWNDWDRDDLKTILNRIQFKKSLKESLLVELAANITCNRLFCPSCANLPI